MLFRLILLGFLFYWGLKLIGGVFRMLTGQGQQEDGQVKGQPPKDTRLHLNEDDIEDADFEEID